jgi:hypothetical protein
MKPFNEAAAKHWFAGALGEVDVPHNAGEPHLLPMLRLTIHTPKDASVVRDVGTLGDGYDEAPPHTLSLAAALLFIKGMRDSGMKGDMLTALFKSCILRAKQLNLKPKDLMTPEATAALTQVEGEMQRDCRSRKKTPAFRKGIPGAKISIVQLKPPRCR